MASMSIITKNSFQSILQRTMNDFENNNDYNNFEGDDFDEIDLNEDKEEECYYFDTDSFLTFKNRDSITHLMIEIDRLSWKLFEINKFAGIDSINIYSTKVARIFDMFNLISDIKFETNGQYVDSKSYLLGTLNHRYKVYLPKEISRIVLSEKITNNQSKGEEFIKSKEDTIELYNSSMPDKILKIKFSDL